MKKGLTVCLLLALLHVDLFAMDVNPGEGKKVFTSRCASCHSVNRQVVGPALRDVDKRHSEDWIIKFVRSSQTVIRSGDTAAFAVFNRFNQVVMPDHPDLEAAAIRNILAFIKEESRVALPAAAAVDAAAFNKPYKNKRGVLDRIVYLNFDGAHRPIRSDDRFTWFLVGMIVVLLLATLYFAVLANTLTDKFRGR
jgi:cytochrome c551/c552